jgi:DNA-binding response OmpR family regulator
MFNRPLSPGARAPGPLDAKPGGGGDGSPRILFADDDNLSRQLVQTILSQAGLSPLLAEDGQQVLEMWRRQPVDLIILDVMMPRLDGFEACRAIRQTSDVPIMMLTSRTGEADVLRGFEAGADDYLSKPFRPKELLARIYAILQRTHRAPAAPAQLAYRELTLDPAAQRLTRREGVVSVSQLEFQILQYMLQRLGRVVSKEDLFKNVWGYAMPAGGMNLVEVAISRLREKIEDDPAQPVYIQTVRGAGYRCGD